MKLIVPSPIKILEMRAMLVSRLVLAGWSMSDIAEIFNVDKATISRIYRKANKNK